MKSGKIRPNVPPKKIGIFSDVHANLPALRQVLFFLLYVQNVDFLLCCGDILGYGCFPNECCQALQANNVQAVYGNHEEYVLMAPTIDTLELGVDPLKKPEKYPQTSRFDRVTLWTSQQLNLNNKYFLSLLPEERVYPDLNLTVRHSLENHEYVDSAKTAAELLSSTRTRFTFIGHTHKPAVWFPDSGHIINHLPVNQSRRLGTKNIDQLIVNVGSVGQPRDINPFASCVVFEPPDTVSFFRLEYEVAEMSSMMNRLKFPQDYIQRLSLGY